MWGESNLSKPPYDDVCSSSLHHSNSETLVFLDLLICSPAERAKKRLARPASAGYEPKLLDGFGYIVRVS